MKFTGERVIPGQVEADLLHEHVARYLFARQFSAGKIVLDAASGSGYGSALLRENAQAVFGVDISQEAVDFSRRNYGAPHVHFGVSDCMALPFPEAKFDLVVAFEIIEHLADPEAFLKELDRVMSPSGLLILSTPNRIYYTEERGEINPFHCREFEYAEFEAILRPLFPHRSILFENHVGGLLVSGPEAPLRQLTPASVVHRENAALPVPILAAEATGATGESESSEAAAARTAHYFVAVCSHRPLEPIAPLLLLPSTSNLLREREVHIHRLTEYLAEAEVQVNQARAEMHRVRDEVFTQRDEMKAVYEAQIAELSGLLEERTQWAKGLEAKMNEPGTRLAALQQDYDAKIQWALSLEQELQQTREILLKLQKEFDERTGWALRLNHQLDECRRDLATLYNSGWYKLGKNLRLSPALPSDPQ